MAALHNTQYKKSQVTTAITTKPWSALHKQCSQDEDEVEMDVTCHTLHSQLVWRTAILTLKDGDGIVLDACPNQFFRVPARTVLIINHQRYYHHDYHHHDIHCRRRRRRRHDHDHHHAHHELDPPAPLRGRHHHHQSHHLSHHYSLSSSLS